MELSGWIIHIIVHNVKSIAYYKICAAREHSCGTNATQHRARNVVEHTVTINRCSQQQGSDSFDINYRAYVAR